MTDTPTRDWTKWLGLALAGTAALRLASLGQVALTDNTESRYASIAWEMYQTGDWVTPRIFMRGELIPFMGKPPLQFWLTNISYHALGISEWTARIPSFLLGLAIVAATVAFAGHVWGRRVALLSGTVLCSTGLFFLLSGACVLDVPLAASVTGAMIAFARFAEFGPWRRAWGVAFFLALAMGALAKGPIALVLVGVALFLWMLAVGRWRLTLQLPWISGLAVFFAVVTPWYWMAERATPGFLRYFLLHEHILRYVSHAYGDLYGGGRTQPLGASWPFLLATFLPWTVLALAGQVKLIRGRGVRVTLREEPWLAFVLAWAMAAPLFFTPAHQILITYLFPSFPGLAIATAVGLDRWIESGAGAALTRWLRWHIAAVAAAALVGAIVAVPCGGAVHLAAAVPIAAGLVIGLGWPVIRSGHPAALAGVLGLTTTAALAATMFLVGPNLSDEHSAKVVLGKLYQDPTAKQRPLVSPMNSDCSPLFYSQAYYGGQFKYPGANGWRVVAKLLDQHGGDIFLFSRWDFKRLKPVVAERLRTVVETPHWVACEEKPR
jgi:4-amino-4-deoxy-L-arabinose transferase-like glycosyltransferase